MRPGSEGEVPTLAETLGGFAASMSTVRLGDDARHHAGRAIIDWFGCALAGGALPPTSNMRRALGGDVQSPPLLGSPPHASVASGVGTALLYPDGATATPRTAALLNGTAAHTVEADDIFRDGIVHPGAPVIAAALAIAQATAASGDAFIRGVVSGYEVATRAGQALGSDHYRLWHTTGTAGTLGAAAACASVLGLGPVEVSHALATSATMASGLQAAIRGDSQNKPLHAGRAAEAGLVAALSAREAVTGSLQVFEQAGGFAEAMTSEGDWRGAVADLGERYNIGLVTFKNHLCCGHTFAAIDAVLKLKGAHGLDVDDVEEIEIATYRAALDVAGSPAAETSAEARFSLPYVVAAALLLGAVRIDAFTEERLHDSRLRELMGRIRLQVDDEFETAFPGRRGARVTVRTRGDEVLERSQPSRRGDPDAPLSDEELAAKFVELATPALGTQGCASLLGRLSSVSEGDHVWIVPEPDTASHPVGP